MTQYRTHRDDHHGGEHAIAGVVHVVERIGLHDGIIGGLAVGLDTSGTIRSRYRIRRQWRVRNVERCGYRR